VLLLAARAGAEGARIALSDDGRGIEGAGGWRPRSLQSRGAAIGASLTFSTASARTCVAILLGAVPAAAGN
jgi:hypothetical protein